MNNQEQEEEKFTITVLLLLITEVIVDTDTVGGQIWHLYLSFTNLTSLYLNLSSLIFNVALSYISNGAFFLMTKNHLVTRTKMREH